MRPTDSSPGVSSHPVVLENGKQETNAQLKNSKITSVVIMVLNFFVKCIMSLAVFIANRFSHRPNEDRTTTTEVENSATPVLAPTPSEVTDQEAMARAEAERMEQAANAKAEAEFAQQEAKAKAEAERAALVEIPANDGSCQAGTIIVRVNVETGDEPFSFTPSKKPINSRIAALQKGIDPSRMGAAIRPAAPKPVKTAQETKPLVDEPTTEQLQPKATTQLDNDHHKNRPKQTKRLPTRRQRPETVIKQ